MSSAAACASARRKRAGNTQPDIKPIKNDKNNNDIDSEINNRNKYTPIQLLAEHNNKINKLEEQINKLSESDMNSVNFENLSSGEINFSKITDYIDNKLQNYNGDSNVNNYDKILSEVNELKTTVINNFNIYLEAANNIININNKLEVLETKLGELSNNNSRSQHNILNELLSNSLLQSYNDEDIDENVMELNIEADNSKLTEEDFINIKNEISNDLSNEVSNEIKNINDELQEIKGDIEEKCDVVEEESIVPEDVIKE